jgi:hypothetical protein
LLNQVLVHDTPPGLGGPHDPERNATSAGSAK